MKNIEIEKRIVVKDGVPEVGLTIRGVEFSIIDEWLDTLLEVCKEEQEEEKVEIPFEEGEEDIDVANPLDFLSWDELASLVDELALLQKHNREEIDRLNTIVEVLVDRIGQDDCK